MFSDRDYDRHFYNPGCYICMLAYSRFLRQFYQSTLCQRQKVLLGYRLSQRYYRFLHSDSTNANGVETSNNPQTKDRTFNPLYNRWAVSFNPALQSYRCLTVPFASTFIVSIVRIVYYLRFNAEDSSCEFLLSTFHSSILVD